MIQPAAVCLLAFGRQFTILIQGREQKTKKYDDTEEEEEEEGRKEGKAGAEQEDGGGEEVRSVHFSPLTDCCLLYTSDAADDC